MADETATERLREMLDERGEPYTTNDHMGAKETSWRGFTAYQLTPSSKLIMHPTPEQAIAATLGSGTCDFTLEYDRDEVEQRKKMYEEEPFGLFPQDMPDSAWTCSNCGQQFKCHYGKDESGMPKLLPVPDWMKCCPSCGSRIRKAVSA